MGCRVTKSNKQQRMQRERAIDSVPASHTAVTAMRAALLIQRWYRQYVARLEMRRRCSWNIFQSIEYSGEQDHIKLYNFFGCLMDHFTPASSQKKWISHIFHESDAFQEMELERYFSYKNIEVPDVHSGPHLTFPLTISNVTELVDAFKNKQKLHAHYVLRLLEKTLMLLRFLPNINHVSTCKYKEITICGDLHGHLEDLLLIFYKNGFPSAETPYVFNGDFVDRGKESIEILLVLFAFQLLYPHDVHLNRGNHEDHIVNLRYGFTKEVLGKYRVHGKQILRLLQKIFSWLPLVTVIDHKVLILHGGISDKTDLNLIAKLDRQRFVSVFRPMRGEASVRQEEAERDDGRRRVQSLSYGTAVRLRPDLPRHSLHSASRQEVGSVEEELSERRRLAGLGLTSEQGSAKVLQTDAWRQVIIPFTSPQHESKTTCVVLECVGPVPKETIHLIKQMCPILSFRVYLHSNTNFPFCLSSVHLAAHPGEIISLLLLLTHVTATVTLQIVDVLWSDPMAQDGCVPNEVRGGGCYWGPDVTQKVLDRHKLQLLIRSHECKQEGYEFCHNRRVLTIFSASNYYDVGSNRGAYIHLGPDHIPHFKPFQASRTTRELTLRQSVGRTERSALQALRMLLFTHKSELMREFHQHDPQHTGLISLRNWAVAMETVLHLGLPWRVLRSQLVSSSHDGMLNYDDWFNQLSIIQPNAKIANTSLLETLYKHHSNLETIFRMIDTDHSGLISFEEFHQTWKLLSSHLQTNISDKAISELAESIDFNKDGSIDINEFMEAFRLVEQSRAERKPSPISAEQTTDKH
ncbi:serine/threonine-protein phosphatase with EF-hands 2-like [Triplophysa rosa]|uniref:serine/threonine-protein phosphatase with EF-hands 2-like n=1 Tax=Triplophysa rosa TaxID=992332 RepID=UPI0025461707|nr:serine/threonine-protein phosphatase with EF-hands 2-like [Triplophysa rosa]